MSYRRKWGTPIWHSSFQCPDWPKSEIEAEERSHKPSSGEFCPYCLAQAFAEKTAITDNDGPSDTPQNRP